LNVGDRVRYTTSGEYAIHEKCRLDTKYNFNSIDFSEITIPIENIKIRSYKKQVKYLKINLEGGKLIWKN